MISATSPRIFTAASTSGCCVGMVAVGGLLAGYGPAIPELQDRFGISAALAGSGLAIQSVGAVAGVIAAQPLIRRLGNRIAVTGSLALIACGAALIAAAPSWSMTLCGAVVAGLGLGGCDTLISQLFLTGQGQRGPLLVNVAHACFGIGTVAAPAVIAAVGAHNYRLVFGGVSVLALVAAAATRGMQPRPTPAEASAAAPPAPHSAPRIAVLIVGGMLALYVAHFAVQSGIGSWEPTRLLDLGHGSTVSGLATSGYWLAMVVGRFVVAPFAHRIAPSTIVLASTIGMTLSVALALASPCTIAAYLLAGFFIGPIFPNGLTWLITTGQASGSRFAYVIAGAMAGAVVCPPLVGVLMGAFGSGALAPSLLVASVAATASAVVVLHAQRTSRADSRNSLSSRPLPQTAHETKGT